MTDLDKMLNDLTSKIDRTRSAGRDVGMFKLDELEQITFEVARLQSIAKDDSHQLKNAEVAFNLHDKAAKALQKAYLKAHPDWPEEMTPGADVVNVWAAIQLGLKPEELG
jgi:hypothetical protein